LGCIKGRSREHNPLGNGDGFVRTTAQFNGARVKNPGQRRGGIALASILLHATNHGRPALYGSHPIRKGEAEVLHKLDTSHVPMIGAEDAKREFDQGTALFVDLRSHAAYTRCHIPGAVSIPLRELFTRYGELPHDQAIIFY